MHFGIDEWLDDSSDLPRPGIGLRPGGERPDLEAELPRSFEAFFRKIRDLAGSASVVVDSSIHRRYVNPMSPWEIATRVLVEQTLTRVHVDCAVDEIRRRYELTGHLVAANGPGCTDDPLERWRAAILDSCDYDLTLDSGLMSPRELCDHLSKFLQSLE